MGDQPLENGPDSNERSVSSVTGDDEIEPGRKSQCGNHGGHGERHDDHGERHDDHGDSTPEMRDRLRDRLRDQLLR